MKLDHKPLKQPTKRELQKQAKRSRIETEKFLKKIRKFEERSRKSNIFVGEQNETSKKESRKS